MTRIFFSSSELPKSLSERQRLSRFQELYSEKISTLEMHLPKDAPLTANCVFMKWDGVATAHSQSTIHKCFRTSKHIAKKTGDGAYNLDFNVGSTPWSINQRGKELVVTRTTPAFVSCSEGMEVHTPGEHAISVLNIPRGLLLNLIPNPDDHILRPLDPTSEPLRHLRYHLKLLNDQENDFKDPTMIAHIRTTLVDLVALTLGARRDAADVARARGLRAARLRMIIAQIQKGFLDPSFSVGHVAIQMKATPRSVQNILQETGRGFVERVNELRLQKAREMLLSTEFDHLKIAEIASKCGFNELSNFYQLFRRRFGDAPGQFRRQKL